MAQFMEATFHTKVVEPELAIGGTTSHGSQHLVTGQGGGGISVWDVKDGGGRVGF